MSVNIRIVEANDTVRRRKVTNSLIARCSEAQVPSGSDNGAWTLILAAVVDNHSYKAGIYHDGNPANDGRRTVKIDEDDADLVGFHLAKPYRSHTDLTEASYGHRTARSRAVSLR